MNITRYEEKSDSLFIRIQGENTYIEHFFTPEERATDDSRKATIEKLMAELSIKEDEYVAPEVAVSKLDEIKKVKFDDKKIEKNKKEIKAERKAKKEIKKEEEHNIEPKKEKGKVGLATTEPDAKLKVI